MPMTLHQRGQPRLWERHREVILLPVLMLHNVFQQSAVVQRRETPVRSLLNRLRNVVEFPAVKAGTRLLDVMPWAVFNRYSANHALLQ